MTAHRKAKSVLRNLSFKTTAMRNHLDCKTGCCGRTIPKSTNLYLRFKTTFYLLKGQKDTALKHRLLEVCLRPVRQLLYKQRGFLSNFPSVVNLSSSRPYCCDKLPLPWSVGRLLVSPICSAVMFWLKQSL